MVPPLAFGPHICPFQERLALNEGSLKQHMQHGILSHKVLLSIGLPGHQPELRSSGWWPSFSHAVTGQSIRALQQCVYIAARSLRDRCASATAFSLLHAGKLHMLTQDPSNALRRYHDHANIPRFSFRCSAACLCCSGIGLRQG